MVFVHTSDFLSFIFGRKQVRSFFDISDKKEWFLDQKIKVLKSAKHDFF